MFIFPLKCLTDSVRTADRERRDRRSTHKINTKLTELICFVGFVFGCCLLCAMLCCVLCAFSYLSIAFFFSIWFVRRFSFVIVDTFCMRLGGVLACLFYIHWISNTRTLKPIGNLWYLIQCTL